MKLSLLLMLLGCASSQHDSEPRNASTNQTDAVDQPGLRKLRPPLCRICGREIDAMDHQIVAIEYRGAFAQSVYRAHFSCHEQRPEVK